MPGWTESKEANAVRVKEVIASGRGFKHNYLHQSLGRIWVHWDTLELGSTDMDMGTGMTQRYDTF